MDEGGARRQDGCHRWSGRPAGSLSTAVLLPSASTAWAGQVVDAVVIPACALAVLPADGDRPRADGLAP